MLTSIIIAIIFLISFNLIFPSSFIPCMPCPFPPLSSPPCSQNHHTIAHVQEFFFSFFAQSLHTPQTPPPPHESSLPAVITFLLVKAGLCILIFSESVVFGGKAAA